MMCFSRVIAVIVSFQECSILSEDCSTNAKTPRYSPEMLRYNIAVNSRIFFPSTLLKSADSYGGQVNRHTPLLCIMPR